MKTTTQTLPKGQCKVVSIARKAMKNVYHRYQKDPDIDIVLALARKGFRIFASKKSPMNRKKRTIMGVFGKGDKHAKA